MRPTRTSRGSRPQRARTDPVGTAFAADLHRIYGLRLGARSDSAAARLGLWLTNSELHCVACYRLGRLAEQLRRRSPLLAVPVLVVYRVLNRWVTHIDHAEISHHARIGPGLLVMHRHGLLIGPAVIGRNVVLHHNVTIGQRSAGSDTGVPRIGDNVWIGPGATLTGAITIGNGVTISAGCVLSKDVPDRCLVAGNPGRVIAQDYDNASMLNLPGPNTDA